MHISSTIIISSVPHPTYFLSSNTLFKYPPGLGCVTIADINLFIKLTLTTFTSAGEVKV